MSEFLQAIADSIAVPPEESEDDKIELNEAQIAELLGDNQAEEESEQVDKPPVSQEPDVIDLDSDELQVVDNDIMDGIDEDMLLGDNGNENAEGSVHANADEGFDENGGETSTGGNSVAERLGEILPDNDVHLDSNDEDILEDFDHTDNTENPTRKRNKNGSESPTGGPSNKRYRPRVQTYFAARAKTVAMISQLLGSWEATLRVDNFEVFKKLALDSLNKVKELADAENKELREELEKVHKQLDAEKRAHEGTHSALKALTSECDIMKKTLTRYSSMITQPVTSQLVTKMFPPPPPPGYHAVTHNILQQTRQATHTPIQHIPPRPQLSASTYRLPNTTGYNFQPRATRAPPLKPFSNTNAYQAATSGRISEETIMNAMRSVSRTAPPTQRSWKPIPHPKNNTGHNFSPVNPGGFQDLIDSSKPNDNTIMLCVPLVIDSKIISCGDYVRLPKCPVIYANLAPNPDLTVTISSTLQDFRENWQLGGKISYEYLGMLDETAIQVYVQVSSMKACGMKSDNGTVDWGVSKAWPCKAKSHKFRVRFHSQQELPVNDRVTVVAVARNQVNNTVHMSQPVFLNLGS